MKRLGKGFSQLRHVRTNRPVLNDIKDYVRRRLINLGCQERYINLCVKQYLLNQDVYDTRLTKYDNWNMIYHTLQARDLYIQSQFCK